MFDDDYTEYAEFTEETESTEYTEYTESEWIESTESVPAWAEEETYYTEPLYIPAETQSVITYDENGIPSQIEPGWLDAWFSTLSTVIIFCTMVLAGSFCGFHLIRR